MKKRTSPQSVLLRGAAIFLVVAVKICFLLPIPIFMMIFNYKVDVSGLFQGELAPREVASMLLDGQTVSNYDKMDERQVLKIYAQNLPEEQIPDTLALGSSRVMQLNSDIVGGSFFNGGMSGAGFMDIANTWYLFERANKLPKNLIICVDPWLFNGTVASEINQNSDSELFSEFLEKALGVASDYEEPDKVALWKSLIEPAYFQGNVRYYLQQKKTGQSTTEDGDVIPFQPVTGDISELDYAIKFPDGSIQYPVSFRTWTNDQVMSEVLGQAGTLQSRHGFPEMDSYWTSLFDSFVQHVQEKGVNVVFLLTPYHPFICRHVHNNPQGFEGFFQVEPWLREYGAAHNIPVYGSYHAGRVGIPEKLFFDGVHCRGEALRLMFPGIEQAVQGLPSTYEAKYLEKYGNKQNTANALIGQDGECVVPDAAWFESACAPS